jgi:hypothetical protein
MTSTLHAPDTRGAIDRFLAEPSVVIVGVSRDPEDLSRAIARRFAESGQRVVAVNPSFTPHTVLEELEGLEGVSTAPSLGAVDGPVNAVVVLLPPADALWIVDECVARGVRRVWLGRGVGSEAAVDLLRTAGIDVVADVCPLMFLSPVRGVHRLHRWLARTTITG